MQEQQNQPNCAEKITFGAVKANGRLKDHIRSAFLHKMLMYVGQDFKEIKFKGITYTVVADRYEPSSFAEDDLIQVIVSCQHWHDGANFAIIRIFNATKPQKV
jgi:hypothetical protein